LVLLLPVLLLPACGAKLRGGMSAQDAADKVHSSDTARPERDSGSPPIHDGSSWVLPDGGDATPPWRDGGGTSMIDAGHEPHNPEPVRHRVVRSKESICQRVDILLCEDFDSYDSVAAMHDARIWTLYPRDRYVDSDPGRRLVREPVETIGVRGQQYRIQTPENPRWQDCEPPGGSSQDAFHYLCESIRTGGGRAQPCPGYEQVYVRFYVRYAEDYFAGCAQHGTSLKGCNSDDQGDCAATAGTTPTGHDFFTAVLDPAGLGPGWYDPENPSTHPDAPRPIGHYRFYSYHYLKKNRWGERFTPEEPFVPEPGRWHVVEYMVKMNTPGTADGEQAYWVDGVKYAHFREMSWRLTRDLQINRFSLSNFIHYSPKVNTIYFDNLVISTNYVGPIRDG
jgi:hypothetical protein